MSVNKSRPKQREEIIKKLSIRTETVNGRRKGADPCSSNERASKEASWQMTALEEEFVGRVERSETRQV